MHLAQPHLKAVHVLGHTPMLFTKPPAQKGAVHKIARPEKKWRFSTPSKWTGGLTGTKKKAFPYEARRKKTWSVNFEFLPSASIELNIVVVLCGLCSWRGQPACMKKFLSPPGSACELNIVWQRNAMRFNICETIRTIEHIVPSNIFYIRKMFFGKEHFLNNKWELLSRFAEIFRPFRGLSYKPTPSS